MGTLLTNGVLINGDGHSVVEDATLVIEGDLVDRIYQGRPKDEDLRRAATVHDLDGGAIVPGVINHHAHRVAYAPAGAYGAPPPPLDQIVKNAERHLSEGTTTLLSVDGFGTHEDAALVSSRVPVNIRSATIAYPSAFEAAKLTDGKGLDAAHLSVVAEQMVATGSPAIGECGAGGTLGGGSQDWLFIPAVVKDRTGKVIEPKQARAIKEAVLGRYIDRAAYDEAALRRALEDAGLLGDFTIEEARALVESSVLPGFESALRSLAEGVEVARRLGVPPIMHNAAASKEVVRKAAMEYRIIAGHSNHPTFEVSEAIALARELKGYGAVIDISTLDMFGAKRLADSENFLALLEADLVDTISTDYAGGFHDSILLGVERAVAAGVVSLARGIRLCTWNVSQAIPGLAPRRGLLAPGWIADLTVTGFPDVSRVTTVFIGGREVFRGDAVLTGTAA